MSRHDITLLGFRDGVFDLVLCSHVLEHVSADVAAMRELYRVTCPGGVALVQVPVGWTLSNTRVLCTEPTRR
jgi:ubiquinone/menaquinone biosynthesis C-methylase UbiE